MSTVLRLRRMGGRKEGGKSKKRTKVSVKKYGKKRRRLKMLVVKS